MRPVVFIFNDRYTLKFSEPTLRLIHDCLELGHPILISDVVDFHASSASQIYCDAIEHPNVIEEKS